MSYLVYPFHLPPAADLTDLQRDGQDCVYCADSSFDDMRPVGRLRGVLVFAHIDCAGTNRMEGGR